MTTADTKRIEKIARESAALAAQDAQEDQRARKARGDARAGPSKLEVGPL